MPDQGVAKLVHETVPGERRDFLYPPQLRVEVISAPSHFPGGLVGRKIVVNESFIHELCAACDIAPDLVVKAIIDRSINRFIRIPESFVQTLHLYASLRGAGIDAKNARHYLEVYLAVWNELDLFSHRDKGHELVSLYRASLDLHEEEQAKLPDHYRILVAVLEKAWSLDLGLQDLRGWELLAEELAKIDYLGSTNREEDIRTFGRLFARCCHIIERTAPKNEEENRNEPRHWPLAGTLDSTLSASDIQEGIAAFLDSFPDKAQAILLLEEFSTFSSTMKDVLGPSALLEASRWWWYMQQADEHRLTVERRLSRKSGRVYPVSPGPWYPEDGTLHLAPLASIGPIGLPGITKRWLLSGPESNYADLQVPDLIVAIDSSCSMPSADNEKSYAVLAGVVAANAYLDHGSQVAVVNFSSQDVVQEFTTEREAIYKHLAAFQGGGTTLNTSTVEGLAGKCSRDVDIMLITDLGLSEFHDTLRRLARHARAHRMFVLSVGASQAQVDEAMKSLPCSVEFHSVSNDQDLVHLSIGAVQRSFADPVSAGPGEEGGGHE